jgi:TolA-binding protein
MLVTIKTPSKPDSTQMAYGVRRGKFIAALVLSIIAGTNIISGCAYYNLFYNAKKSFREAEAGPRTPEGKASRPTMDIYDKVIEKCELLITNYPKSRYVDDAVLLMGKSFYAKEEYDLAIVKFEELQTNFPKSHWNEEGQLYLAKSYIDSGASASAVPVLEALYQAKPKGRFAQEVLLLLGTTSIGMGDEPDAVKYLEILADRYPRSLLRLDADIEMAELYTKRGEYEKALVLYTKLSRVQLSKENTIRYLDKLSVLYLEMAKYDEALETVHKLRNYVLDPEMVASKMLLEGKAYAGIGATEKAVDSYQSVVAGYPKTAHSAEAYFRLGEIYQDELDSLNVAREKYDEVSREWPNSPFATDAIRRSVSIVKFQRLQASVDQGDAQQKATANFELAEAELLQFNDHEKALTGYQGVLNDYPTSDVAPKAAYAIAYIYQRILGDKTKAEAAYRRLLRDYPGSQQAEYARKYFEQNRPLELEETRSDS